MKNTRRLLILALATAHYAMEVLASADHAMENVFAAISNQLEIAGLGGNQ